MNLGFGVMRFGNYTENIDYSEVQNAIEEYMRGEVCYFDLHPAYVVGQSQYIFRKYVAEKYDRDRYLVANKMPYYGISDYSDYRRFFGSELDACGVSYFDYYLLHCVTEEIHDMHSRLCGYDFLKELKLEGLAKNIGISFHGTPELLKEILEKHSELDFVQLQINWLDWTDPIIQSQKNYDLAREYNKKIIVMEPLKGGTLLQNESKVDMIRTSFSFFSNLEGIEFILSGMTTKRQVEDNRKIFDELSRKAIGEGSYYEQIYDELRSRYKRLGKIGCTNCRYCVAECPRLIPIPNILNLLNTYNSLAGKGVAFLGSSISNYRSVVYKKGRAGECILCGRCEKRCPQNLTIREYLRQARDMFEEKHYYSAERNVQILIYLLKEHNIKNIIVSPGATNVSFVQSVQCDSFFRIFSVIDERSAAYMAIGLARETGEPVVLSCTGATASRNYLSAFTEAFYSKIPVIAVTSSQPNGRIGHNVPQMLDRRNVANDVATISVELPVVKDDEDEWTCTINANKAILSALDGRKGPAHINLVTSFNGNFSVRHLPPATVIKKHTSIFDDNFEIAGKTAVFCGAHNPWNSELLKSVDAFCEKYNAVVITDHTGNYRGKYGITSSLIFTQEVPSALNDFDLVVHIGNISGAYYKIKTKKVWRVNPDGEIVDTFRKLSDVFEMEEIDFFESFVTKDNEKQNDCTDHAITLWRNEENDLRTRIQDLPFSNIWIAQQMTKSLPHDSVIHFGILNSLRSFNLFPLSPEVDGYSNTGGFGIDGCVSSLIGASWSNPSKLYFGVVGDLAFFYDMNSLGNRHIGSNIRLVVVNNGCGVEFLNYNHAVSVLNDTEKSLIAAKGHNGNQSSSLIKSYAENLGFKYLSARSKEEYFAVAEDFLYPGVESQSIVLEVFTEPEDESEALMIVNRLRGVKKENRQYDVCKIPNRFIDQKGKWTLVLWGTGNVYSQNIVRISRDFEPYMVCDNDDRKWGKPINGVMCGSPAELKKIPKPFVVIMVKSAAASLQIVNQLMDMGIMDFDNYDNWKDYADESDYVSLR